MRELKVGGIYVVEAYHLVFRYLIVAELEDRSGEPFFIGVKEKCELSNGPYMTVIFDKNGMEVGEDLVFPDRRRITGKSKATTKWFKLVSRETK